MRRDMIQIERPRLSHIQRLRLKLFQITLTGKKPRPGWKGYLQFYAFEYSEHGIVEDYPHRYRQVLSCPECQASRHIMEQ